MQIVFNIFLPIIVNIFIIIPNRSSQYNLHEPAVNQQSNVDNAVVPATQQTIH